ncbi:MAG: xanthine phosphoribosyltransferase [Eubacterium sp.]|nr:xanthine phosphoribosyltransferase [Eubacterium sp.]
MKALEERIRKDGKVYPGNILKVDSFLNHQIDIALMDEIAEELYDIYKEEGVTRILTIEASGIAIASSVARVFKVPMVFAKKAKSKNIGGNVYTSRVTSFTYKKDYDITLSKSFLGAEDKVLVVDDFLATGSAMKGLLKICKYAGAKVVGVGICIEKGFQPGGKEIRDMGYDVTSLAIIEEMTSDGRIIFK